MAVESRFVVIRNGAEVETFMDKKAADEYDKMLDMADNLSELFTNAPIELNDSITEELSIFLAQNRDDVLVALQAKKAKVAKPAIVKQEPAKPAAVKIAAAKPVVVKKESAKASTEKVTEQVAKAKPSKKKKVDEPLSQAS